MRRFMVLVTVGLVMTAMLVAGAAPTLAALRPPIAAIGSGGGTPLPTVVCETTVASPLIGWHNGQCWVFHAASASFF